MSGSRSILIHEPKRAGICIHLQHVAYTRALRLRVPRLPLDIFHLNVQEMEMSLGAFGLFQLHYYLFAECNCIQIGGGETVFYRHEPSVSAGVGQPPSACFHDAYNIHTQCANVM